MIHVVSKLRQGKKTGHAQKNENNIQVEIDLSLYCNGNNLPGEKVKTLFVKDY